MTLFLKVRQTKVVIFSERHTPRFKSGAEAKFWTANLSKD